MKLKSNKDKVDFLFRSGKDLVKNQMTIAAARHIINNGEIKKSTVAGYPINVDDIWYFKGEAKKRVLSKTEGIK